MIVTSLQNSLWDSNTTKWNFGCIPMESIHLFLWSSSMCVIMVRMCCCRRTVENCGHSILDTHLNPALVIRPVIGGFIMSSAWSWKAAPRALCELFVLWPDDTQCLELHNFSALMLQPCCVLLRDNTTALFQNQISLST